MLARIIVKITLDVHKTASICVNILKSYSIYISNLWLVSSTIHFIYIYTNIFVYLYYYIYKYIYVITGL